ncbi:MAG: nuclear transport factor 2 family protein [Chloroflexota bacterium]|nr:nuclear transport factor 2 family protein [Chloroflexota bacterium]
MSREVAQRFIDALYKLELERDVEPIVGMYAENAAVGNVIVPEKFKGPDGARQFWSEYRETFGDMKSEFRNIIASEGRAALEWTTKGTDRDGDPLQYDGVSILEIDGDKIARFRAYFDPSGLGRQIKD